MSEMISLEEARALVLSHVCALPVERAAVLDVVGRVAACDLSSDIDVAPFDHSAMDGFALRAKQVQDASEGNPVELDVIAEVAAGDFYDGPIGEGECVRIMTGAPLPETADSVVKYEVVENVLGAGRPGGRVSFTAPCKPGANVRRAGEEAHAGEVVVHAGEVVTPGGVGFLASCGVIEAETYARPRVAVIATGSELVDASEVPTRGKIRNSNSYALAALVAEAGGVPAILPVAADSLEGLTQVVCAAADEYDFVVTSGGAANGDFDFIKKVVAGSGELLMTTVNIRPGKAQTFGIVNGTPVFGLPGNPAAAYVGFEMLVRPALRKMQGYSHFDRPHLKAHLASDVHKRDTRRFFNRATISRDDAGYVVTPAKNQSSGLFGPLQRCNCFVILPEGAHSFEAGCELECILLDVSEEVGL